MQIRNLMLTKKYLIDNNLLAIPFDTGVGICNIKKEVYHAKMKTILELPEFEMEEKGKIDIELY